MKSCDMWLTSTCWVLTAQCKSVSPSSSLAYTRSRNLSAKNSSALSWRCFMHKCSTVWPRCTLSITDKRSSSSSSSNISTCPFLAATWTGFRPCSSRHQHISGATDNNLLTISRFPSSSAMWRGDDFWESEIRASPGAPLQRWLLGPVALLRVRRRFLEHGYETISTRYGSCWSSCWNFVASPFDGAS